MFFPAVLKIELIWFFFWPNTSLVLTHYTLNFIFYKSLAIDTLHDPYLHFCYELALEASAKRSSIKSLRVYDLCHDHPLASLQWSGPSDHWTLLPTERTATNGAPKQAEEPYLRLFVSKKKREMAKLFLQPTKAAVMCTAPHLLC